MNELNEVWTQDLDKALAAAKVTGRYELADYLSLRASNDAIRQESIKWLFDGVLEIVFAFNRHGARITIDQKEKHSFKFGNSSLSGSALHLRQGVRCLSFEAGWTQTPNDGVMKAGALACARISHFGFAKQTEELALHRFEDVPQWFSLDGENHRISFNLRGLRKHFETFLG
ncbi:MAG: hypothetical protein KDB79_10215 [Acidobacteria bacterium]|nr:hypothetical protein [Acidobacteriota bacterium]